MASNAIQGSDLQRMVQVANAFLEEQKETINSLNVFPVPDGDTGSNMCLTMRAALDQMSGGGGDLEQTVNALSYGSLMGARGNSGVILSQIIRGIAKELEGRSEADGVAIARALAEGARTAYRAVMRPVEGTILTVGKEAAAAAGRAADKGGDVDAVLDAACHAARVALARTPEQLEVLKRAGVVDAGGQGLVRILEGLLAGWRGEDAPEVADAAPTRVAFELSEDLADITYPYDTELLIRGTDVDMDQLRDQLETLGDSIVLVDGGTLTKVHIHTSHPGDVLSTCLVHGDIDDVIIKNMIEQHRQLEHMPGGDGWSVPAFTPTVEAERPVNQVGLVVVAAGEGFSRLFEELGADAVVPGGQTMNPSTQEVLSAVDGVAADTVIILPNNSNVILTCRQVDALTEKTVHVVGSRDMAQGIAALLPWQPDSTADHLVPVMEQAIRDVTTGAVTYAVREASINDVEVSEGSVLGLANGEILVTGADPDSVLFDLVSRIITDDSEIVSVYAGGMIDDQHMKDLSDALESRFDDLEVEVLFGGQDHYYFLVSVE